MSYKDSPERKRREVCILSMSRFSSYSCHPPSFELTIQLWYVFGCHINLFVIHINSFALFSITSVARGIELFFTCTYRLQSPLNSNNRNHSDDSIPFYLSPGNYAFAFVAIFAFFVLCCFSFFPVHNRFKWMHLPIQTNMFVCNVATSVKYIEYFNKFEKRIFISVRLILRNSNILVHSLKIRKYSLSFARQTLKLYFPISVVLYT